jgi:S1-C subfamily serine protease
VDPDGPGAAAGLQQGDVIAQVNGQTVKTPAELKSALSKSGDRPALLLVTRENNDLYLTLRK